MKVKYIKMLTLNKFSFCYYTKDVHCFRPKEDNCIQNVLSDEGYDLTYRLWHDCSCNHILGPTCSKRMPTVVNETTKLVELMRKLTTELVSFQNKINHCKTCLKFTVNPHHHYGMVRLRVLQIWKTPSINSIIHTHNWWLAAGNIPPCYKTLHRVLTSNLDLANTGWGKRHLTRPVYC